MPPQAPRSPAGKTPAYSILIVDDNPANLGVITEYLKALNCRLSVATTGKNGIKRARTNRPDLILLDVVLPGMNGYEVCRQLKADPLTQDIPIIFMTVLNTVDDKVRAFQEGAVDYVTKPIQVEEVTARVMTHLQIQDLTRSLQAQKAELVRVNAELSKVNIENQTLNERLRAENIQVSRNLFESQHKYLTLAEEISDGYVVLQAGRIVFANRAFAEMHGKPPDAVHGQDFRQFVDPEHRELVMRFYEKSCRDLQDSPLIGYRRITASGQYFPTEIKIKSLSHDNMPFTIGICRDITERVEMERKTRENARLSAIGRMASSLSHELRNPLSAVNMNLQLLQEDEQLSKDGRRCLSISIEAMHDVEHSLSQLLDFVKPLTLQLAECSLSEMLSDCITLLEGKLSAKELTVANECHGDPGRIRADSDRVSQALLNILLNAVEASPHGGTIRTDIRSSTQDDVSGIGVSIADEGPGITTGDADSVFEPFFTTKARGTGLGLANVQQIAEAHHGSIRFETHRPRGTVFTLWLPVDAGVRE